MSLDALLRDAQRAARALALAIAHAETECTSPGVGRLVLAQAGNAHAIADALWALRLSLDAELVRQQRANAYLPQRTEHQAERRLPYAERDQT